MVAERFGKQHKDVLESIRELSEGGAEKSAGLFIPSQYQHPQNKQWYPEYLLTRDGFTLLVMGFTGKEALQFKLAYIEAFNKMEEELRKQSNKGQHPAPPLTYKEALKALVEQVELNEKLEAENAEKQKELEVTRPKSQYCDMVLMADGTVPITIIAKDYGLSAVTMNKLLHKYGVQYKMGGTWVLYAKHQDQGYITTETGTKDILLKEYIVKEYYSEQREAVKFIATASFFV